MTDKKKNSNIVKLNESKNATKGSVPVDEVNSTKPKEIKSYIRIERYFKLPGHLAAYVLKMVDIANDTEVVSEKIIAGPDVLQTVLARGFDWLHPINK